MGGTTNYVLRAACCVLRAQLRPKSLIVIGFPDHAGRCVATVRMMLAKAGLGGVRVECVPACCYPPDWSVCGCQPVTGYDPSSTQPWTTSRYGFLVKEAGIRVAMGVWLAHPKQTNVMKLLGLA